ncbi:hypothetical protein AB1K56_08055 [Microbacterium sp. BWR-S6Y]|uniref:hypothetical protein n=1 Tax=Microbacterium sp. BWR-S6Y TaxID=3232073 RepID=UPI003526EC28
MSAFDVVPTVEETAGDTPEELEEWLTETFAEFAELNVQRGYHDADGFYAELAGSPACLARGHVARVDEGHPLFDEWADAHPMSWDGDARLCEATQYGTACSACETDCGLFWEPPSLWTLPGVRGQETRPERSPLLCPECRDGKCRNCVGEAMTDADEMVPCGCPNHTNGSLT